MSAPNSSAHEAGTGGSRAVGDGADGAPADAGEHRCRVVEFAIRTSVDACCQMFAVLVGDVGPRTDSSVCRVSERVYGYGDDLMNSTRLGETRIGSGIRLIVVVPERVANGTADRGDPATPWEADPRRMECPGAHPLRRTRAKKLYQLVCFRFFASFRTESLKLGGNPV